MLQGFWVIQIKQFVVIIIIIVIFIALIFQINQLEKAREQSKNTTLVKTLQNLGISSKAGILQKGGTTNVTKTIYS